MGFLDLRMSRVLDIRKLWFALAALLLFCGPSAKSEVTLVYGPKTFRAPLFKQNKFQTVNFELPQGSQSPYTLTIINGLENRILLKDCHGRGLKRLFCEIENQLKKAKQKFYSARQVEIRLNDKSIVRQRDFNLNTPTLQKTVDLLANNRLQVRVKGWITSQIILKIEGKAQDNQAPLADFTYTPTSIDTPYLIEFDASLSNDPDQNIVEYKWTFEDGSTFQGSKIQKNFHQEGLFQVTLKVTDSEDLSDSITRTIELIDEDAPLIMLASPQPGANIDSLDVVISGSTNEMVTAVKVNNVELQLSSDQQFFNGTIQTNESGRFTLHVEAIDRAGNVGVLDVQVNITASPNELPIPLFKTSGTSGLAPFLVLFDASDSSDSDGYIQNYTWDFGDTKNGEGPNISHQFETPGSYKVTLTVTDDRGAQATHEKHISVLDINLPPDPAGIAPALSLQPVATVADYASFLYTGENAIQTAVLPGTIEEERAFVIRGQILKDNGEPLAGATVSINGMPQYGQTLSRADGFYDFAVNGGGAITLNFDRPGYLPSQRKLSSNWQHYTTIDPVILKKLDAQATFVQMDQADSTIISSSVSQDMAGERQVKIRIPSNTKAQLEMPNGALVDIGSLTLRATEYTVGSNGPQALPGPLPPMSAYTYAVELSADEAIVTGAKSVKFSRPVPFYVNNFLDIPVGFQVPLAYYDRDRAAWIPEKDGRVIEMLGRDETTQQAIIDVSGTGGAASTAELASLNISSEELKDLSSIYEVGDKIWRMEVNHLTPWDCNFPYTFPPDATAPEQIEAPRFDNGGRDSGEEPKQCGSVIELNNKVWTETISQGALDFSLNYRSDRALDFLGRRTLTVQVTGPEDNPSRAEVRFSIGGKQYKKEFLNPGPNYYTTMEWDGRDPFGRLLMGTQYGSLRIDYFYQLLYVEPNPDFIRSFNFPGIVGTILPRNGFEGSLKKEFIVKLEGSDSPNLNIGGWSPSIHHQYDPANKKLTLGSGEVISPGENSLIITTFAGTGEPGYNSGPTLEGKATDYPLNGPHDVLVAPNGDVYIANSYNCKVEKVDREGNLTTVVGTGVCQPWGETPTADSPLSYPLKIRLDKEGRLYIFDYREIRRLEPGGELTLVAGGGSSTLLEEGVSATGVRLFLTDFIVSNEDEVYLASNSRIWKIGEDGLLYVVAGLGTDNSEGALARDAGFGHIKALAFDSEGLLNFSSGGRIIRITNDGRFRRIAGSGIYTGEENDGAPALDAQFAFVTDIEFAPNGELFFLTQGGTIQGHILGKIDVIGHFRLVAGMVSRRGYNGDNIPSRTALLDNPLGMDVGPNGHVYIADTDNHRIRRLTPVFPEYSLNGYFIASPHKEEIYEFSKTGLHLNTRDTLTGATIHQFGYNEQNQLINITDAYGRSTDFLRDSSGQVREIVNPDGHVFSLSYDSSGYLSQFSNPNLESYEMTYSAGGLLKSFKKPKGNVTNVLYDPAGFFLRETNHAGGFIELITESLYEKELLYASGRVDKISIGSEQSADYTFGRVNSTGEGYEATYSDFSSSVLNTDGTFQESKLGPSAYYGMLSPIIEKKTTTLPSGLMFTEENFSSVFPETATSLDEIQTRINIKRINGRDYTEVFNNELNRFAQTSPEGRQLSYEIDDTRNILAVQLANFEPLQYTYGNQGRLTSAAQGTRLTQYNYNPQGFVSQIINPINQSLEFTYDAAGRVIKQTLPDSREILFGYDANGNLTSVTPPGRDTHYFTFNLLDNLGEYSPPPLNESPSHTTYLYNLDGEPSRIDRPDGTTILFSYDPQSFNLASVITPQGIYAYTYNSAGQVMNVSSPYGINISQTYDGFLPTSESWTGAISGSVSITYDQNFQLQRTDINSQTISDYTYDNDGLLIQAGLATLTRDPNHGEINSVQVGNISEQLTYNNYGELQSSLSNQYSYALERDDLGRVTKKIETIFGSTSTYDYTYDASGRLTAVKINGTPHSLYSYDQNSNRLSKTESSAQVHATYDNQDRLLTYGPNSYSYNANGDLTVKSSTLNINPTRYEYDAFGNLISVTLPDGTSIEYLIDGKNRRVGKKINGSLTQGFLYQDELNPIAEINSLGQIQSYFVYASKSHVPEYMIKDGVAYKLITDYLGSVRVVINVETESIAQRIDYDEFGSVTQDTNPGFQPFGFAGGIYDHHTGLVRFGARDYDPETGRWTSKDPILFAGGDTNLYGYVLSDPVNLIDPDGLRYRVCSRPLNGAPGQIGSIRHDYLQFDNGDTYSFGPAPGENPFDPRGNISSNQPESGQGAQCSPYSNDSSRDDEIRRRAEQNFLRNYNLYNFNCQDFVRDSIGRGR